MINHPAGLPLFYGQPEPLSADLHADWRLLDGDVAFAAETAFVPVLASEIPAAARAYPIVFTADTTTPIAVVGLEHVNLFVDGGIWDATAYVPAYVRRHPFAFMATPAPDGFCLAIDVASPRISQGGEAGTALFDDGKPSALTRQALDFCAAFGRDAAVTDAFIAALGEQDILIDRRADATMPDGRTFGLHGFRIVDREKFAALPDSVVLAWHKAGYLALIHLHIASLDRFATLLDRQTALLAGLASDDDGPDGSIASPEKASAS